MTTTVYSYAKAKSTVLTLSPIKCDTMITLIEKRTHILLVQNDELFDILPKYYPIMNIVRAIRRQCKDIKLEYLPLN